MDRSEEFEDWKAMVEAFCSRPKEWKIFVKEITVAPDGWDETVHPPWSPARVYYATLPSANRSDLPTARRINDKHPMVSSIT